MKDERMGGKSPNTTCWTRLRNHMRSPQLVLVLPLRHMLTFFAWQTVSKKRGCLISQTQQLADLVLVLITLLQHHFSCSTLRYFPVTLCTTHMLRAMNLERLT